MLANLAAGYPASSARTLSPANLKVYLVSAGRGIDVSEP